MGKQLSITQPFDTFFSRGHEFSIALDYANYEEGSEASGSVNFILNTETPPLMINIHLIGYENIYWVVRKTKKLKDENGRIVDDLTHYNYKDQKVCCYKKFTVKKYEDDLDPDDYEHRFKFNIPDGIPGTYAHDSGFDWTKMRGDCSYIVYGELLAGSESGDPGEIIGRAACPIVITQKPRKEIRYNITEKKSTDVTSWWGLNRGSVELTLTLDKNVFTMDDTISGKFKIDALKGKNGVKGLNLFF